MNKNYRQKKSQENWKSKAKVRGSENIKLRKLVNRLEEKALLDKMNHNKEMEHLKCEIQNSLILANSETNKISLLGESRQRMRVLCVRLLTVGGVSFRSVPKILKTISDSIGISKIPPHFTSVINWTLRTAIGIFKNVSPIKEPWIAVIDFSNNRGTQKVLVVLRVLLCTLGKKGKAISFEDAECIGIVSNDVWNGDTVKSALATVFLKAGMPLAILKDGGSDIKRGVRLYCEEEKSKNIVVIDDVGHYVANALKAEFQKDPDFEKFIELLKTGSSKIRQSIVAWALPPKLRVKGRFQGITRLADWAQNMLLILDKNENNISPKEMAVLSKTFSGLIELRPFIEKFITSCEITEQFLQTMKNSGFNKKTIAESKKILSQLPSQSIVKRRISTWLAKHQEIYFQTGMGTQTLLVSSDIIESLFGKFKSIIERSPSGELNRLIYIIPLLCGKKTEAEIGRALQQCSHIEMKNYISTNIPTTIRQQRLKLLKKTKSRVPKPGNFDGEKAA